MLQKFNAPERSKLNIIDPTDDSPGGFIEGYASVFGNVDLGGDIVVKGAFSKTLKERLKTGAIKLIDSHRVMAGTEKVIGVVSDAKEDDYGLWFRGKVSTVQSAQDVRVKIREGILNALSFGYDVVKATRDEKQPEITYLKELKLHEISVVIWGMNPEAKITTVKSFDAVAAAQQKLASIDYPWDPIEARKRVEAHAASKSPEGDVTFDDFCIFISKDSETVVCVMDIVDDEPQVVFNAVEAALIGLRDGTIKVSEEEASAIEKVLEFFYSKFEQPFPAKGHVIQPQRVILSALAQTAAEIRMKTLLYQMARR